MQKGGLILDAGGEIAAAAMARVSWFVCLGAVKKF
jgi:hypothetical protein